MLECPKCKVEYKEIKGSYEQFGVVIQGISRFECPICHCKVFRGNEVDKIQESIKRMGPKVVKRKVTKAAGRPAIYLPANLLEELGIDVGQEVYLYIRNKRLLVDPNL
jgi:hypothetical protein